MQAPKSPCGNELIAELFYFAVCRHFGGNDSNCVCTGSSSAKVNSVKPAIKQEREAAAAAVCVCGGVCVRGAVAAETSCFIAFLLCSSSTLSSDLFFLSVDKSECRLLNERMHPNPRGHARSYTHVQILARTCSPPVLL